MSNTNKKKFKPIGSKVKNFDKKLSEHVDDNELWQKLSREEKELDNLEEEIKSLKKSRDKKNFFEKIKLNLEISKKERHLTKKKNKWLASAMPNFLKEAMKDE